ncbi:3-isopropylmalate dehydratase small subunit [Dyella flava]|uniref:3-isopropylmalate dehydratase small subunit n=1 Tax=Dyella flava TaxID=1920170 RepID=A0ABS2K025_9GAMM|nr:3-isopropylmalate dehydratase small subunit [Dyella flava]MBM7124486.1 3-isopropylmalate dehydratase small subunit [Dyella flava]GLQ51849.1 3-isopropylmalate dehydratase small subunit [Dyella flava]
MQAFTTVHGIMAALPAANIDTDVIMPKQFLKGIDRAGLADGCFHDLRFDAQGVLRKDFVLNQSPWNRSSFLVTGPNFGCGSSREHAVWGLRQLGIRALLGTSFAGIFYDNCLRNGVLAVSLPDRYWQELVQLAQKPAHAALAIDLPAGKLTLTDGRTLPFELDALSREALIEGRDAIDSTLRFAALIGRFEQAHHAAKPWLA